MAEVLIVTGFVTLLIGISVMLVAAFNESVVWGAFCVFVPMILLVFAAMYWKAARLGFLITIAGIPLIMLGGILWRGG